VTTANVLDVVIDPTDHTHVYAATTTAGVVDSTDGGTTWHRLNGGLPTTSIEALTIDAGGGALYAGTYDEPFGVLQRAAL
jgi:hypothetical protein